MAMPWPNPKPAGQDAVVWFMLCTNLGVFHVARLSSVQADSPGNNVLHGLTISQGTQT